MGEFPGPYEVEGSCVCRSAGGHQQGSAGVPQRVHGGDAEGRVPGERGVGGDGEEGDDQSSFGCFQNEIQLLCIQKVQKQFLPPQTIDRSSHYTEEELREYEEQLSNEQNNLDRKAAELLQQKDELQRKEEQLQAQKLGLQQVNLLAVCS